MSRVILCVVALALTGLSVTLEGLIGLPDAPTQATPDR